MMLDKQALDDVKQLEERWAKNYERRYRDLKLNATTKSGIPLKPVYTPADVENLDINDIGVPGEYPYTRGLYPLQYQVMRWQNQNAFGFGLPENTRERMELLMKEGGLRGHLEGQMAFLIPMDAPTLAGYDPDHELSNGKVGMCGLTLSNLGDMEILFKDLDLTNIHFYPDILTPSPVFLSLYVAYANKRGFDEKTLHGCFQNILYNQWWWDCAMFPPKSSFKLIVDMIRYCTEHMPQFDTTNVDGYNPGDAGATPAQQLAFAVGTGIAIVEECKKTGLDPDAFVPRLSFHMGVGSDFFENIAMLRALRRMWAKLGKERFGCTKPKAMQARIAIETSGASLTKEQPMNNVVRGTLQTLAAALAGVDSLYTTPYDEAYSIPTKEAVTMAFRTQQVIEHESGIINVTDPLGGSYYVEWLTNRIEQEALSLIDEMDKNGGYIKCAESGWLKRQVQSSASKWREAVDSGDEVIVGVNQYIEENSSGVPDVFEVDPAVEKIAVDRIKAYRENRDNAKTTAALNRVKEEAKKLNDGNGGYVMPAMVDAVKADATLGELMQVLRDEFGWGYTY